jgi:2-desacetyl-2-hydroxyethyl bacteriochlorophyllide A dehydrogenase
MGGTRRLDGLGEAGAWPRGPLPVHDARSVPDGTVLDYDLCVVGTGAAGVTAVLALAGRGLRIAVIEGGGVLADDVTAGFTAVESTGRPGVAADSRERWLGGTTNAWTGGKTILDPIDMRARAWVPDSGWPLDWAELHAAYGRAAALLDRPGPDAYEVGEAADAADGVVLAGDSLRTLAFHQDAHPLRFGSLLRERIGHGDGVDLYTLANVTEVELDEGGGRVGGVELETLHGNRFRIRARGVALACGAIENARLLLASRSARPAGLGNGHDVVGRYYQDHPKGFTGVIDVDPTTRRLPASRYWPRRPGRGGGWRWGIGLTEGAQQREAVLNSYVRLEPIVMADVPPGTAALRRLPRDLVRGRFRRLDPRPLTSLPSELPALGRLARFRVGNAGPIDAIRVRSFLEQQPERTNRVRLAEGRDPLGLPLAAVDADLTELDRETVAVLHRTLGDAVTDHGIGTLHARLDDSAWDAMTGASHHAGTTRMGTDPNRSVTGPDGQVHEVPGLFVLGASLFPTSGFANPVFTIAATSLLVADHIAHHLAAQPTAVRPPAPTTVPRPTPAGRSEVARWVADRRRARRVRPPAASRATAIVWTRPHQVELVPVEVADPGPGEVAVLVDVSAVSAGTERARWLALPGAPVRYPHHPGYSLAGTVHAVGPGVYDLEPGARVGVWGAPHQSLVTVGRRQAHALAPGTDPAAASLVTLGAIAAFGVARTGGVEGRSVAVVGAGAIGLLTQRLAAAAGAGPCTVVAASDAKDAVALGDPAVKLARPAEIDGIGSDLVVEATGSGPGLELALRAAAPGATIVLLGTTRAQAVPVPLDLIQDRGLRLVGAHAGLLDRPGGTDGLDRRRAAEVFLGGLAHGALDVADLVSMHADPANAAALYARLARDRSLVTPVFDWWRLPTDLRAATGAIALPNPFRRGLAADGGGDGVAPAAPDGSASGEVVEHPPPVPLAARPMAAPDPSASIEHADADAVARAVAEVLPPGGRVQVTGSTPAAESVRAALERIGVPVAGPPGSHGDGPLAVLEDEPPPPVAVVTGSDATTLREALDGLDPGGTVVVAGPAGRVDLDVQALVHKRGATIVGVGVSG